jgi:uncharacterized protein YndB with AHSA1/START domain
MDSLGTFATSRHFGESPDAIFDAFADAATLASWWGPDGFTNEFESFDFRPGGTWKFVMIGPDGRRYPNESVFSRVEPASLVVIRHVVPPHFTLTIELTDAQGGTRLDWTQAFDDPKVASAIRHIVEPANEQNLDRLAAALRRRHRIA